MLVGWAGATHGEMTGASLAVTMIGQAFVLALALANILLFMDWTETDRDGQSTRC